MTAPAWMPLYVADYLADTGHLSAAQSGAYLHLIMHYWQRGAIPLPMAEQARVARMTLAEWEEARPVIEAFFLPGWRHRRIDEERQKAAETMRKRSAAGKANASQRGTNAKPMANQLTIPSPSPSPKEEESKNSVGSDEPTVRKPFVYPEEYDALWNEYRSICDAAKAEPGSKKNAFEKWRRLSPSDRELCVTGVFDYLGWRMDRQEQPNVFTAPPKHFERFISGRLWETYQSEAA